MVSPGFGRLNIGFVDKAGEHVHLLLATEVSFLMLLKLCILVNADSAAAHWV